MIWDFLRSELEMDGRFKTMEMKLNLIQDNLKVCPAAPCRVAADAAPCCTALGPGAPAALVLPGLAGVAVGTRCSKGASACPCVSLSCPGTLRLRHSEVALCPARQLCVHCEYLFNWPHL